MTKEQVFETLRAAHERVGNRALPIDVRIRSRETVALCEERIRREGWADEVQPGLDYINKATHRVVHVTAVEGDSVRFHEVGDDYPFVESLHYFRNDFRQYQEG